MRLGTFAKPGSNAWRPALFESDADLVDLEAALAATGLPATTDDAVAARPGEPLFWLQPRGQQLAAQVAAQAGPAHRHALADVRIGPPMPTPGKFIAVGRNYMNHVKEGQQIWAARGRKVELPTFPASFTKHASCICGTGDAIVIPPGVNGVDYEVELALVIGRPALRVSEEDALSCVAGYTVCNDIGARELQRLEMESQIGLTLSKNFPGFGPIGPWFVTADEIPDPQALTLELRVNGQRRQHASTADMIFSVRRIVAYWSQLGLQPGDLITTGTPSGVALAMPEPEKYYLRPGDLVEAQVSGIGTLVNRMA
jgi:2-keto-4-pentenoate hydratase/2-oxohepta-3-ene-1,7-dioic acid hydratase in catechol pathway